MMPLNSTPLLPLRFPCPDQACAALTIATGEQPCFANLLLAVGVVQLATEGS